MFFLFTLPYKGYPNNKIWKAFENAVTMWDNLCHANNVVMHHRTT